MLWELVMEPEVHQPSNYIQLAATAAGAGHLAKKKFSSEVWTGARVCIELTPPPGAGGSSVGTRPISGTSLEKNFFR